MAQTTERLLIRKVVRLTEDQYVIFDKELDKYRVAVWRPRIPNEQGGVPLADVHQGMTQAGLIPKRERIYWFRVAGFAGSLDLALRGAMRAAKLEGRYADLIHYVRSTEWGGEL